MKRSTTTFLPTVSSNKRTKSVNAAFPHVQMWQSYYSQSCTNQTAINLTKQLDQSNVLGYPNLKLGKITKMASMAQERHPDHVILIAVGDFAESYGLSAIALIEFGGLRSMGAVPTMRAGTPLLSLQRLLTALVSQDLYVSLYEEKIDPITRVIDRVLTHVLSQAKPTAFALPKSKRTRKQFDATSDDDDDATIPKVVVNIDADATLRVFDCMSNEFEVFDGLDLHAACAVIDTHDTHKVFADKKHFNAVKRCIPNVERMSHEDVLQTYFKDKHYLPTWRQRDVARIETRLPLSKNVCTQINFTRNITNKDADIPALMPLLIGTAPSYVKAFFHALLITNPSRDRAAAISTVCEEVLLGGYIVAPANTYTSATNIIGTIVSSSLVTKPNVLPYLLRICTEGKVVIDTQLMFAATGRRDLNTSAMYNVLRPLIESCILTEPILDQIVAETRINADHPIATYISKNVRVQLQPGDLQPICSKVDDLASLVQGYTWEYSVAENDIYVSSRTSPGPQFKAALTAKGRIRRSAWTIPAAVQHSQALQQLLADVSLDDAKRLQVLAAELTGYVDFIRHTVTCFIALKAIHCHATTAIRSGWSRGEILNDTAAAANKMYATGLFPYWIGIDTRVASDVTLATGTTSFITGPNASGKSTFLRTTLIAGILNNLGLFLPAKGFTAPFFDSFHLRLPCTDRPNLALSGFASEAKDVGYILQHVTATSLVVVDEIARGTSNIEGLAMCQAVIEALNRKQVTVLFATHLHDILDIFVDSPKLTLDDAFHVIVGERRTSNALVVCREHNWPNDVIERTKELLQEEDMGDTSAEHMDEETKFDFEGLIKVAQQTICAPYQVYHIAVDTMPPPAILLQDAALYIIEESPGLFYIGESADVIRRQHEHDTCNSRRGRMCIFTQLDKTASLKSEALLIRAASQRGFAISSLTDGNHKFR